MRARTTWFRIAIAAWLGLAPGCGDDSEESDGSSQQHAGHGGSGHGGAGSDGGHSEAPCPPSIPDFAIDLEAEGDEGLITGRIVDASSIPPRLERNDWTVEFVDASGTPLADAELDEVEPFMPVHNHGGRYPPEVMALSEPGRFQADALDLWMRGPWEVRFDVSSASAGDDHVVFHVCID